MQKRKEKAQRGMTAATLLFIWCAGTLPVFATAEELMTPAEATSAKVAVAASELPISLFFAYITPLADLRLELEGELPGSVSGRFEGSVQSIVEQLATQHQFAWWLNDETLHLAPASTLQTVVKPWTGTPELIASLTDTMSINDHNTITESPAGLRISGLTAFVAAVESNMANTNAVQLNVPKLPTRKLPASPLDGLDRIPGFNTF